MQTDPQVLRSLAILRGPPLVRLPSQVKAGPFSFFGNIPVASTVIQDMRQAVARSDSQLDQLGAGNQPAIKLCISALEVVIDGSNSPANPTDTFFAAQQLFLQHEHQGVTRFVFLGPFCTSHESNPSMTAAGTFMPGPAQYGPRLLAIPMVVDLEHDAIFGVFTRTGVALANPLPFSLRIWGIACPNTLAIGVTDCYDTKTAVTIGEQAAVIDPLASAAINPDAYR
jgi:hypothetical protein